MASVFVVGVAVVDFVFSVGEFPRDGEKFRAKDAQIVGGGCAANAAVAVSRLDGEAHLAARLGDDQMGDLILSQLDQEGVDITTVHRAAEGRSSFSSVYVDDQGERQIMNFRGSNLTAETDWIKAPANCDAVMVDTRWTDGARRGLEIARQRDIPGVIDAEAPFEPELLSLGTHIAFSRSGLKSIRPDDDLAAGLASIVATIPGWACVTDGENGVYYTSGETIRHMPAFPVEAKDTLAAGDIWHGAFALLLGEGMDEESAIRFANGAAAMKSMKFGGRTGCPNRQALNAYLEENE